MNGFWLLASGRIRPEASSQKPVVISMIVRAIYYEPGFLKDWKRLDRRFRVAAAKAERMFRDNPLHPSLRLHQLQGKLQGLWSISISFDLRIIFKRMDNGDIVFLAIGRHNVYR